LSGLFDFFQSASNAVADNVAGPVDLINSGLGLFGLRSKEPVGGSEWMKRWGLKRDVEMGGARLAGETAGLLSPTLLAAKAPQIAAAILKAEENAAIPQTLSKQAGAIIRPGEIGFDRRFDPRVKESQRLETLTTTVEPRLMQEAKPLSLADLEGQPFITSMSDRTAAGGQLTGINGVNLSRPVDLRGGQDFMFDNPGQVWASARGPVKQLTELADDIKRVTGKDPLYMPWRMAPTGGDFAAMTGETMLSYAKESLGKRDSAKLDKTISALIPGWKGVANDLSVAQFRAAPDATRKVIKNQMDVLFRERGGLGIGEARLAVADPKQLAGPDGGLMNVGRIFAGKPAIAESGHPSYPFGVPGEGVGRLQEARGIFELLPSIVRARGITDPRLPDPTDLRALQMKPYAGMIDAELLKSLGY
jgi:hypothetical protein